MSIASVSSSSYGQYQLLEFKQQHQQQQLREQTESPWHEHQLLESVNRHKKRCIDALLRVELLECQIREEMEKLFSVITSSSSSYSIPSTSSSHHIITSMIVGVS